MTESHGLGPLEMRVFGLLERDVPMAVSEVKRKLDAQGPELAYTTVMTVLVRLHEKGLATRRKDGNRYIYLASTSSGRLRTKILTRVKESLFQTDRARPILALLADDELSEGELRALRKAIDARLKGRTE